MLLRAFTAGIVCILVLFQLIQISLPLGRTTRSGPGISSRGVRNISAILSELHTLEPQLRRAHGPGSELPSVQPGARLIAIGDIHGDYDQAVNALTLCGVIDEGEHWRAGHDVVVQTGDLVDRGPESLAVVGLFERLKAEAMLAGGDVILLLGNHELMNIQGDFRYVSKAELRTIALDSKIPAAASPDAGGGPHTPVAVRGMQRWMAMLLPSQPLGRLLRNRLATAVLGAGQCRSLFVHAGVLPGILGQQGVQRSAIGVELLVALNRAMHGLLSECSSPSCGLEARSPQHKLIGDDGPLWYRGYATKPEKAICNHVSGVLQAVHAKRMVIGHTIQESGMVGTRCGGLVHLIDVGMSRSYLGKLAAWKCTPHEGPSAVYPGQGSVRLVETASTASTGRVDGRFDTRNA